MKYFNSIKVLLITCFALTVSGCSEKWDVYEQGIPHFVNSDYIELNKIDRISRFRSSEGHDYSDAHEQCRSMKHYFHPYDNIDWAGIKIFSPVAGTIRMVINDREGVTLLIQSSEYPAFRFIIFHVNLAKGYKAGDEVRAGEQIGTHTGNETFSDIAIKVREGALKDRLVSYFEVMSDGLFIEYQKRGATSRQDFIISRSERDSDPISCDGQEFLNRGSIESWFHLW